MRGENRKVVLIRAIVWKELREQGLIALTLIVLGGGVLVAAAELADPPTPNATPADVVKYLGMGQLATLMLAVTAGMVCGGAVFAAEREAGTFSFLDSLPVSRWQLWQAKLLAGLGLVVGQVALLLAVAVALGLLATSERIIAISLYSLLAFVWGMLGSTTARTTLGSVGIAIPAATLTALFVLIPVTLFFQSPGATMPRFSGLILFLVCMFAIPLLISAWLFTTLDRTRAEEDEPTRSTPLVLSHPKDFSPQLQTSRRQSPERHRPRLGLTALLWLSFRQLMLPGVVLSIFALFFGLILLIPSVQPFVAWPVLALTAGVVAGVMAFADEQTRGSARFWGEQRLPIIRVWVLKIGVYFAFCIWLLALLALPIALRAEFEELRHNTRAHSFLATMIRSPLFDELGPQGWKYLFVPAAYGFAAGHLCGLLFRKLVVACGVAGIVGGVCAALWGPSLLSGGVKHWQLWSPPLVGLLTGLFLMREWVAERIATRAAIAKLVGGCVATLLVMIAGIGYRVLEIPERMNGEDDIAFIAGLPPFEKNDGGRDFKMASERYNRLTTFVNPQIEGREIGLNTSRPERIEERIERVLRTGWPDADDKFRKQLGDWLDRMFVESSPVPEELTWHRTALTAAERPVGIFEYPQSMGLSGPSIVPLDFARRMAIALLVRGLQKQTNGDPTDFAVRFRAAIALARTLRNGSVVAGYLAGAEVERSALVALDRWLERLPLDSEHIRPAIGWVSMLEPNAPFDPTPHFLAERYVLREGMKTPAQWLPNLLSSQNEPPEATATEVDFVGIAWAVPWERERIRRVIGLGFESGVPNNASVIAGRPGLGLLVGRARSPKDLADLDQLLTAHRRASALKVALRAYRAERGAYPTTLTALEKTGYLSRLPTDPYDDARTFGYRLSKEPGDLLVAAPRLTTDRADGIEQRPVAGAQEPIRVPAGQAIIWSVGPDKGDQGGLSIPVGMVLGPVRPLDLVYLVPLGKSQ